MGIPIKRSLVSVVVVAAFFAAALLQPAPAGGASNIGGGAASGNVSFSGSGVPPAGQPCRATSFTLSGIAPAFVLNTVIMGHLGPVDIQGSGGSTCESATAGSGTLTLTNVRGTGFTGSTIDCANPTDGTTLAGGFTRVGTSVEAVLGGTCKLNGFPARILFEFHGEFEPSNIGGGVTTSITEAVFQGAFVVAPA